MDVRKFFIFSLLYIGLFTSYAEELPQLVIDSQKVCFIHKETKEIFVPYGVNYDHDKDFKLIEQFWTDTKKISKAFSEIKSMGFNIVRIHVQQFILQKGKDEFDDKELSNLDVLIKIARENGLYIDLTGLGRYNGVIPDWYKNLDDSGRIETDGNFWKVLTQKYKDNTTIFCFDLQNEPVINNADHQGFVGEPFDDGYRYINRHFQNIGKLWTGYLRNKYKDGKTVSVSWVSKCLQDGNMMDDIKLPMGYQILPEELKDFLEFQDSLAISWLAPIFTSVKTIDPNRLVTVGLSELNMPFSEYYASFDPQLISPYVDFISIHIYPATLSQTPYTDNNDTIKLIMRASYVGKPVVAEEFYPLVPLHQLYENFIRFGRNSINGWISFYWGRTVADLKSSDKLGDHITAEWLEYFSRNRAKIEKTEFPIRIPCNAAIKTTKLYLRTSRENREKFLNEYKQTAANKDYVDVTYQK